MRNPSVFLTASGILVAVLALWTQLWLKAPPLSAWTTHVGLLWNYGAMFIVLLAFVTVAWNTVRPGEQASVTTPAVGFFLMGGLMALIEVAVSFATLFAKSLTNQRLNEPIDWWIFSQRDATAWCWFVVSWVLLIVFVYFVTTVGPGGTRLIQLWRRRVASSAFWRDLTS